MPSHHDLNEANNIRQTRPPSLLSSMFEHIYIFLEKKKVGGKAHAGLLYCGDFLLVPSVPSSFPFLTLWACKINADIYIETILKLKRQKTVVNYCESVVLSPIRKSIFIRFIHNHPFIHPSIAIHTYTFPHTRPTVSSHLPLPTLSTTHSFTRSSIHLYIDSSVRHSSIFINRRYAYKHCCKTNFFELHFRYSTEVQELIPLNLVK